MSITPDGTALPMENDACDESDECGIAVPENDEVNQGPSGGEEED